MNSYRNSTVDILAQNICLSKAELYQKTGIENKREFLAQIERLIAEKRIRYEADFNGKFREVLSPKVLNLTEFENRYNIHTRTFQINYVPTEVLERELEYVNPNCGDPFEDTLDFHLEIIGYKLEEKYKAFFEAENGFTLDFSKFNYTLSAEYLFHKHKEDKSQSNIIYINADLELAEKFKNEVKEHYVPDSIWHHFLHSTEALVFLEQTLQNRTFIDIIVLRCKSVVDTLDFIEKFEKLLTEFEEVYSDLIIPVMFIDEVGSITDFVAKLSKNNFHYLQYPADEDAYILGNVIRSQCEKA